MVKSNVRYIEYGLQFWPSQLFGVSRINAITIKLGYKEQFDKEQIGIKEPFPVTNLPFT